MTIACHKSALCMLTNEYFKLYHKASILVAYLSLTVPINILSGTFNHLTVVACVPLQSQCFYKESLLNAQFNNGFKLDKAMFVVSIIGVFMLQKVIFGLLCISYIVRAWD